MVDTAIVGPHLPSECFFHVTERMKPRLEISLGHHFSYFFLTLRTSVCQQILMLIFFFESLLATQATTKRSLNPNSEGKETSPQQDIAFKWEKCQRLHLVYFAILIDFMWKALRYCGDEQWAEG